jgi:hypothetical protein
VLEDGRLTVTYSNEKHNGYSQLISEKVSTDNGLTWGGELLVVVEPGGGSLRPGMSQMARMANGQYILVYEVVGYGNADVYSKVSADGANWPEGLGVRIPCHHCGPFVTSLPDGRLLVSSCENQVSVSEDFGETWQKIDPPAWNLGFNWSWPAVYGTQTNEVAVMVASGGVKLRFGSLASPKLWPNPFTATFDNGTDPNWARYGGNFGFTNGCYSLNNEGAYGKALAGDGFWTDGTLEADIMLTSPGDAGLMFRTTNPDYTGPDAASGYYAGLNTAGSVFLGKMNNSWTLLTSAPVSVRTNTWYRLKVVMQGDVYKVFVDNLNQPKLSWNDSSFGHGQIGVRSFQSDARFDNITFSNAVPLRLNLRRSGAQLDFSWPQTALSLQLCAAAQPDPILWTPLTNASLCSNGQWTLSLPMPPEPSSFYRLLAR